MEMQTVKVTVENYRYDPREWLDAECTIENPCFDPEEYTEIEKPVLYVTVYAISRHCGGSEEGGWYYNWWEPVCSVPLIDPGSKEEIEAIKAFLKPRFEDEGDIYSVRGGTAYSMCEEYAAGENQSTRTPRYE
jgi:hypothetical protein